MNFPIQLAFRIFTLHPQIRVTDSVGALIGYVQQNFWRLKEEVTIFTNEAKTEPIYKIHADNILDFTGNYAITNVQGADVGVVHRDGFASLWRAHYEITTRGGAKFTVSEHSVLVRMLDQTLGEIPVLGAFTGYFLNPSYEIKSVTGDIVAMMHKRRSFLESLFTIEKHGDVSAAEQECLMLSLMMIVLLERKRG